LFSSGPGAIRLAAALALADRRYQVGLLHPPGSGDAKLLSELPELGYGEGGKATAGVTGSASRPGRSAIGGRATDGGSLVERGGRATEEFGGIAH
jgi:hypothetical protein